MVDGSSSHNLAGRALAVLLLTSAVTPPAVWRVDNIGATTVVEAAALDRMASTIDLTGTELGLQTAVGAAAIANRVFADFVLAATVDQLDIDLAGLPGERQRVLVARERRLVEVTAGQEVAVRVALRRDFVDFQQVAVAVNCGPAKITPAGSSARGIFAGAFTLSAIVQDDRASFGRALLLGELLSGKGEVLELGSVLVADFAGSGQVDLGEFMVFADNFGRTASG